MSAPSRPGEDDLFKEQPFVAHLLELRDRLLRGLAAVLLLFLALFYFANDIYLFVAAPLMAHLPQGTTMIATEVASPFLTPFKLTLMVSIFLSMPYLLYQLWAFVAPGLYRHERRLVLPLVLSSTLLYYIGMAFAYFVVFPLIFAFLVGTAPDGITVATDISRYLDFILTLFFAFGIAFEVPIATILVVWMGLTTPEKLREKRPYVVVAAFVIGMLLTPPDVISQTLLALPMWILFEVGIFCSQLFVRGAESSTEGDATAPAAAGATAAPHPAETAEEPTIDPERYTPLTPEELDRELDLAEEEEAGLEETPPPEDEAEGDPITQKLRKIQQLREQEKWREARVLLYEILAEGDEQQQGVARNILEQLDE